jgi:hypothetical protein
LPEAVIHPTFDLNQNENIMIIWRGQGLVVLVYFFVFAWISSFFFDDTTFGNKLYVGTTLLLAAVPTYFHGKKLAMGSQSAYEKVEEGEEREPIVADFFFIPLKYWGFIFVGLGGWALVSHLIG